MLVGCAVCESVWKPLETWDASRRSLRIESGTGRVRGKGTAGNRSVRSFRIFRKCRGAEYAAFSIDWSRNANAMSSCSGVPGGLGRKKGKCECLSV